MVELEKKILDLMEIVSYLQLGEIYDELELTETEGYSMPYLMREILMNELKKRRGERHIDLETARKHLERKQAAL